jgi:hypothetical protein
MLLPPRLEPSPPLAAVLRFSGGARARVFWALAPAVAPALAPGAVIGSSCHTPSAGRTGNHWDTRATHAFEASHSTSRSWPQTPARRRPVTRCNSRMMPPRRSPVAVCVACSHACARWGEPRPASQPASRLRCIITTCYKPPARAATAQSEQRRTCTRALHSPRSCHRSSGRTRGRALDRRAAHAHAHASAVAHGVLP